MKTILIVLDTWAKPAVKETIVFLEDIKDSMKYSTPMVNPESKRFLADQDGKIEMDLDDGVYMFVAYGDYKRTYPTTIRAGDALKVYLCL